MNASGFQTRREQADRLIKLFETEYWSQPNIADARGFIHEPHGYETHQSPQVREFLRTRRDDATAKSIRFRSDFLLLAQTGGGRGVTMLEYKSTTTPRYTAGPAQWDQGQIEADPWEYYAQLRRSGNRLALLNYCSYHSRPLLCDFPSEEWVVGGRQRVAHTVRGSRTDYVNIDLLKIRIFEEFMKDEFGVPCEVSEPLVHRILVKARLDALLQTRHDRRSQDQDKTTGWNWPRRE